MLLAIDVGNTLTDFGFFADDKLLNSYLMDSDTKRSEDETRSILAGDVEWMAKSNNDVLAGFYARV